MDWQPIETAPKDGRSLVLYCEKGAEILRDCMWKNDAWYEWTIDVFDNLEYCRLELYFKPTHWFEITPPGGTDEQAKNKA